MLKPKEYIDRLQNAVNLSSSFSIVSTEEVGDLLDIIVKDKNGEDIFIMMKDAKSYGELPLGSIFQVGKVKDEHPRVLLVSFSRIDKDIQGIFMNMGVHFLVKPTVEETMRKLTEIAGLDIYAVAYA